MINLLTHSGSQVIQFVRYIGELTVLLCRTIGSIFFFPFNGYRFLAQAKRIGIGSFFIVSLVSFFVGMIIALQMAYLMVKMSAEIYIPNVLAVAIVRELAPVLTALIVAGRIGAGMTAEIGSMVVTEQVDALKAFATNPVRYLVLPRFLALVVMLPILTIFADLIGILGGFVICVFKLSIKPTMFFNMVVDSLVRKDIMTGLIKTIFFGMIIALVGCHQGLTVKGGAEGVGKATTVSVVRAFILILIVDCFFTTIFYFIFNA